MPEFTDPAFVIWASWAGWLLVIVLGWTLRSRAYGIFRGVTLGLHNLILLPLLPSMGPLLLPAILGLHLTVFVESAVLIRPRMRPTWYRLLVSWPALFFSASTLLAWPWAIAAALGLPPYGVFVPYLLGAVGMVQSLSVRSESRGIVVGAVEPMDGLQRVDRSLSQPPPEGFPDSPNCHPLRVVQISDPHLGPFMPVKRLQEICARAVQQRPDLILLTGDFLTMESQRDERWLTEALAPLRDLPGRVFACLGNHDHEAPRTIARALASAGATLLVDEETIVDTPAGPVQLLGFDFHFSHRAEKMAAVTSACPRVDGALRLALLHDPGAFKHLPDGEVDLALSGHTHGGQVGLVSLGLQWTLAGWIARMPDHGLWGKGQGRLYVHRGTGHYGFPLRLGVPAEESVLAIYRAENPSQRTPKST